MSGRLEAADLMRGTGIGSVLTNLVPGKNPRPAPLVIFQKALNLPGGAIGAVQPGVGLVIAHELLVGRIPFQGAFMPEGQVAEVAHRYGTAADLDVADRLFAGTNALDPVLVMAVATVKVDVIGTEWGFLDRFRLRLELAAIHADLAVLADEHHAKRIVL